MEPVTFNKYVKPPSDAIWDTNMCRRVHGLHCEHEKIRDADDIATVWNQFYEFIKSNIGRQQVGVLVAWNGVTCDMRWIYKLRQAPNSIFQLPTNIKYFMDPMSVIREYKGCKLNKKHSKIESYELGVVWSFIKKCNLNGAHDSLVDVKAQTDIVIHPEFLKYINKTKTYRTIENIFSASEQSKLRKKLESSRDIHKPWEELDERSDRWNPPSENTYTGFASGGRMGASNTIINCAKKTKYIPLAKLFLILFPFQVIQW